jgi:hypothetical protein
LRSWGYRAWNGCDLQTRQNHVADTDEIRVVQNHSIGLEGWYTMLVDLDDSYAHRLAHPNIRADDRRTPESVAASWLLMARCSPAAAYRHRQRDSSCSTTALSWRRIESRRRSRGPAA